MSARGAGVAASHLFYVLTPLRPLHANLLLGFGKTFDTRLGHQRVDYMMAEKNNNKFNELVSSPPAHGVFRVSYGRQKSQNDS